MTTTDILREKVGVCRQFVKIFSEMCAHAGLRAKNIRGYVKGFTQGKLSIVNRLIVIYAIHYLRSFKGKCVSRVS